ncbi:MAG: EamA family transporter [bacterium]
MSWIFYAILSAIAAALVAIFGKIGIKNIDTTLATTARAVVMAFVLMIVSLSLGRWHLISTIGKKPMLFLLLSGLAGAVSWLFYFVALKKGPASGVAALDRLSVVFVLVLALFILGEHLTWKNGFGAFLITAGAILMTIK